MSKIFHLGKKCENSACLCAGQAGAALRPGGVKPPLHDGCDCYIVDVAGNPTRYVDGLDHRRRMIQVRITLRDLSEIFRERDSDRQIVTRGGKIPPDARFVGALMPDHDTLLMIFEHDSFELSAELPPFPQFDARIDGIEK